MAMRVVFDSGNVAAVAALDGVRIAGARFATWAIYVTFGNAGNTAQWEASPDGVSWFTSAFGALAAGHNAFGIIPTIYLRINKTAHVAGNDRFWIIADIEGG